MSPEIEFAENPENRCPVVLLLDTSGSMSGAPIAALNEGIAAFKQEVERDDLAKLRVEVAVVRFGPVSLVQDFVTMDGFTPPRLEATGLTPMAEAIEYALDLIERRKETYKTNGITYYRPWVFLITDGEPDGGSLWQRAAQRVHEAEAQRKVCFFAVGVEGANMEILRQIAPPDRPPAKLQGLRFREMFEWLSKSMTRVSAGKVGEQQALPPATGWMTVQC